MSTALQTIWRACCLVVMRGYFARVVLLMLRYARSANGSFNVHQDATLGRSQPLVEEMFVQKPDRATRLLRHVSLLLPVV